MTAQRITDASEWLNSRTGVMLIRQLSLLMTSPADYHHFPLASCSMQAGPGTLLCVCVYVRARHRWRRSEVPPDMVYGGRTAGGEATRDQQALAASTCCALSRGDQPGSREECGGRQPAAQVSSWRAEVVFSRPEADQAVCQTWQCWGTKPWETGQTNPAKLSGGWC